MLYNAANLCCEKSKSSHKHLLDLVQVICSSVINIVKESCGYHRHYLQVSVVSLQHSCLSTQRHTRYCHAVYKDIHLS